MNNLNEHINKNRQLSSPHTELNITQSLFCRCNECPIRKCGVFVNVQSGRFKQDTYKNNGDRGATGTVPLSS